ncbi:TIGR04197 family type VII secretion effector [Listeria booriae]|nr:TIGR04197 family type VII secretion effector [Listeria booriae]
MVFFSSLDSAEKIATKIGFASDSLVAAKRNFILDSRTTLTINQTAQEINGKALQLLESFNSELNGFVNNITSVAKEFERNDVLIAQKIGPIQEMVEDMSTYIDAKGG